MNNEIILKMIGITKDFPGVSALKNVDLGLCKGEVLAVVGENGAGKSTLAKVLSGVVEKDKGEIIFFGKRVNINSPRTAQELGISTIFQELNLISTMSVSENIYIQNLPHDKIGLVKFNELKQKTKKLLELLEVRLSPDAEVGSLSIAEQQMVEILKVISLDSKIMVMDEPTSSLSEKETKNLFRLIKRLKNEGISIVYVSHKIEEIFEIADRVMVLRDGKKISEMDVRDTDLGRVIKDMVGRDIKDRFPGRGKIFGNIILEVKNLTKSGKFYDININLRSGEILGIAGLVGAGRTELANAIFGADSYDSGKIFLNSKEVNIKSPLDAINFGIGMVPEDRKEKGLILSLTVKANITLPTIRELTQAGLINFREEIKLANDIVKKFSIKTPSINSPTINLSGGNQQKVILAKWLQIKPKILILDEPTRGIDVGAKVDIFELMRKLADQGVGIIMINSELPEIMGLSDKIIVMSSGRNTGEFKGSECTAEEIMVCATKLVDKNTV